MDEFTMITKNNRNDGDDNVNIDVVRGRSEIESEEKDLMNISKKYALASDTLDHGEECEEKKEKTCNTKNIFTEYDDDLIQSDNDQHKNNEVSEETDLRIEMTKNILELGHSEENKTDELEREKLFLSKKSQKEKILMIKLILILVLICQKLSIEIIVKNVKKKKKKLVTQKF